MSSAPTTHSGHLQEAVDSRDRHRTTRLLLLPWALLAATVAVQIAFPFTDGGTLALTTASVLLLAATSLTHLALTRGPWAAAALAIVAGGGGLIAEAVGVRTGFPFGSYVYTDGLGLKIAGVPLLVPLAWIMMSWPALVVARRLVDRIGLVGPIGRAATALTGACALTAWDVFLDPQMVDQGHWRWAFPEPSLPGVADIPLTNFAGWLLVSLVMTTMLDRVIAPTTESTSPTADAVPIAVYLWTYFSSVLAHAAFFGRGSVAVTGGVIMGAVAIPLLVTVIRARPRARR